MILGNHYCLDLLILCTNKDKEPPENARRDRTITLFLAFIFLQLIISERSGIGVPIIVGRYGKDSIQIEKNRIIVIISFEKIEVNKFLVANKVSNKVNGTQEKIISAIRNNSNVTINQLMVITGLSEPGVKKNLKQLKH